MRKLLSFRGGVYPPDKKSFTEDKEIQVCKVPNIVKIPLQQHIGAPCEALVKPGDKVKMGQKIGQPKGYVSAPVHSSVSGTVKAIEIVSLPNSHKSQTVVIENDGLDTLDDTLKPSDLQQLSADELKEIIMEAGIVGMGGASFPTHVKLSPPPEKEIHTIILNGSECEPYLTADSRLMMEYADDIVFGLKVIMKTLGVTKGYIGIEDNKPDAISMMTAAVANEPNIQIMSLRTKYPQGSEKHLIYALTRCQVPSGRLPIDVGTIVDNVSTAAAIARAVRYGEPSYQRVVTVTGNAVKEPQNLLVRVGTSLQDVVDFCGGLKEEPAKVICGGPMMGTAQHSLDVPVIKGTTGILLFTQAEAAIPESSNCIRCGRCVAVCPTRLMPFYISAQSINGNYEETDKLNAMDCIECGSCTFICPAKRPLMQHIRIAKKEIMAARKKKALAK